jgi:hypothetical protein
MATTKKQRLEERAKEAKEAAEAGHASVDLATRRIAFFIEKRDKLGPQAPPGEVSRLNRKVRWWKRRKHQLIGIANNRDKILANRIEAVRDWLRWVAQHTQHGVDLVRWGQKYLGTKEGSARQVKWSADLGYDSALPWCSIFCATGIKETYQLPLPSNPSYSGNWMEWDHGRSVAIRKRRAGDLLIYDWGDGGITDHVAICDGQGGRLGGNQDHEVNVRPEDAEFLVAVVRPTLGG